MYSTMSPSALNSNPNKETIETRGFHQPLKPSSGVLDEMMIPSHGRRSRRQFFAQRAANAANGPTMDTSSSRPMSKSFSCPSLGSFSSSSSLEAASEDHGEYIEIVLRGNDTRDDNETRWVSSDEDEGEGEDGAKVNEEDEGEADYEELIEPQSWEEEDEEDEDEDEEDDNHNYYDVDEDDDNVDDNDGAFITYLSPVEDDDGDVESTSSNDDKNDGIESMELWRKGTELQKYNELLEEDTLRLRRTYQWLQETLAEEQKAISVTKANHIMDKYQLQTQIDMLQEDNQILTEKVATLEATIVELTIKSTFHTNRINSLEEELQQHEQRKIHHRMTTTTKV